MSARGPAPKKRTNVRLKALRSVFAGLSRISPAAAARLATTLFRRPPRHRGSEVGRVTLESGERADLRLDGRRIAVWKWGRGPTALLVHGWGSRGARLGSFVGPLTDAGYSVVAFDAPGHGASEGRLSSLPQFIAAIREIGDRLGPVDAVVAHSMGGAASTLAIHRGLPVRRAVFLAPSSDPAGYSDRFAAILRLSPDVLGRMKRGLGQEFGMAWEEFDVISAARSTSASLLVFHDREDRDVPVTDGEASVAAWPGAELVLTKALGHRRIVHDPSVVSRAVDFLTSARDQSPRPAQRIL